MRDGYKDWLEAQGYADNTRSSQLSTIRKLERAYGEPMEVVITQGGLPGLMAELTYSRADERAGRPNPSRIAIPGGSIWKALQTTKTALARYARFLGAESNEPPALPPDTTRADPTRAGPAVLAEMANLEKQKLSLERDMQTALRRDIAALEPGLLIVDDGAERAVSSGFIDILARDAAGVAVVIELKAGKTDARVIGQILGYMGDLAFEDEEPVVRGILVAHEFDQRTRSAVRAVPNLTLVIYAVSFRFDPVGRA